MEVSIVMYHYVRDLKNSRYPNIKGLNTSDFEKQVKYLKAHFHIVTMEDVLEALNEQGGGISALPKNAALLTFDDGYIDHFTNVFPILQAEKIQGSFFMPGKTFCEHKLLDVNKIHFIIAAADINALLQESFRLLDYYRGIEFPIPSNKELFDEYAVANRFDSKEVIFVKRLLQTVLPEELRNIITSIIFEKYIGLSEEKFAHEIYMDEKQIQCMKSAGMHIGIHGYDHYWLGNLSKTEMKKDIDKALDAMSGLIDVSSWVMNYPYGSYNEQVIEYIKTKGCKLGLTTEVKVADIKVGSAYKLPRFDTNDFPPISKNI